MLPLWSKRAYLLTPATYSYIQHLALIQGTAWLFVQRCTLPKHAAKGCLNPEVSVQGLQAVAALLVVPEYRAAVLEGLVASIGGLDASLSKAASAALLHTLSSPPEGVLPGPASAFSRSRSLRMVSRLFRCLARLGLPLGTEAPIMTSKG